MMRKSQIEALALNAMRDAMAAEKSEQDIILAGIDAFGKHYLAQVYKNMGRTISLYNKHFTVKEPN